MEQGKKFKDLITIEKSDDELENEKKVETLLKADEDKASHVRKKFLSKQIQELNDQINSRTLNYRQRRNSITDPNKHQSTLESKRNRTNIKLPKI